MWLLQLFFDVPLHLFHEIKLYFSKWVLFFRSLWLNQAAQEIRNPPICCCHHVFNMSLKLEFLNTRERSVYYTKNILVHFLTHSVTMLFHTQHSWTSHASNRSLQIIDSSLHWYNTLRLMKKYWATQCKFKTQHFESI